MRCLPADPKGLHNKNNAMKYAIRSVKYFFYFSFWTTVIVLALVATGLASGDINELFEGGYNALWKIAIFFALVAAVYPKVQFISRRMYVNGEMKDHSQAIASYMMDQRYELESETADTMTFRVKGLGGKILKMCEDRIVITKTEEGFFMEGLRKDVLKIASGLEYRLNPQE